MSSILGSIMFELYTIVNLFKEYLNLTIKAVLN